MNEARENPLVPGEKAKNPTGDFVLVWEDRALWGVGALTSAPTLKPSRELPVGPGSNGEGCWFLPCSRIHSGIITDSARRASVSTPGVDLLCPHLGAGVSGVPRLAVPLGAHQACTDMAHLLPS